jgi:predicted glycogen debranching enzyme
MNDQPAARKLSRNEWLEADGLGGFASGTSDCIRTRRYHALLLVATTPPTGRMVLVNGFDAWVETKEGRYELSSQSYAPGIVGGEGIKYLEAFDWRPWPHWIYKLPNGARIEQEIFAAKGSPITCVSWKVLGPRREAKLFVRPFLSGRDYHSMHKANPGFCFEPSVGKQRVTWHPYPGVPGVTALTNGKYSHEPLWYYNFLYEEERARGLDCEEDLAALGVFSWNLAEGPAALILTTREHAETELPGALDPANLLAQLRRSEEKRRGDFASPLEAAADNYIAQRRRSVAQEKALLRGNGRPEEKTNGKTREKTIIAGYPWFADWGRDTFIALRGLCLATGRLADARSILTAWAGAVSEGMLPNRFPDQGEQPEFNSVDASLWFIIAAYEYLQAATKGTTSAPDESILLGAIEGILEGYASGTRYGIHMDDDALLAAGQPGLQLTWMDAKVGDWVVTPRIGKPVEVQALWINALWIAHQFTSRWEDKLSRAVWSFRERFWNPERGFLNDVVDVNHRVGMIDATLRPNQIFAVGGLPLPLLEGELARLVVETVEDHLLTPIGLRTLGPKEPGYCAQCAGGVAQRDGAYHQGTVWPWLLGPFVEAWVQVHGNTTEAKRAARQRFLAPFLRHLEEAGLGHISEIADAEPPHAPRGCPFQAWSLGEILRLDRIVLAAPDSKPRPKRKRDLVAA